MSNPSVDKELSEKEERELLNPTGGPILENFKFKKPKIIPLKLESLDILPIQGPQKQIYFTPEMIRNQEKRIKLRQIPVDLPLPVFANSIIRKTDTTMEWKGADKIDEPQISSSDISGNNI